MTDRVRDFTTFEQQKEKLAVAYARQSRCEAARLATRGAGQQASVALLAVWAVAASLHTMSA